MFYNSILLKWIGLHQFPFYSFFVAKLISPPLSNLKDFIFFYFLFNIVFEFLKCFRTWSLFLNIFISIVMFLSLVKVIKYLALLKDLVVMGPQMLVCTRSKTLSTFHLLIFRKKISTISVWNIFHKWDIHFKKLGYS